MDNNPLRNVLTVDIDINDNGEMHNEPNIINNSSS